MSDRDSDIAAFLDGAGWSAATREPLAGDASARRYDRLRQAGETAVLMDAALDPSGTLAFVRLSDWLCAQGFSAPRVLAAAPATGLLLLEDLGDDLFARVLSRNPDLSERLYSAAIDMLAALQQRPPPPGLPVWNAATLGALTDPFVTAFAPRAGIDPARAAAVPGAVSALAAELLGAQRVACLRDVHAENLIWLPARPGLAAVGLLDFQDAFLGHPAYDAVSLLFDARRDLPDGLPDRMLDRFAAATGAEAESLRAAAALLTAQRNLRILGIFSRLAEAGKPGYLRHAPRVLGHLRRALRHPALAQLSRALGDRPEGLHTDA